MKLQSQLNDAELAQMHANVIETMGGIPEPKWIKGPDNIDYRSYTALKKANTGMPSTEQVYRDMPLIVMTEDRSEPGSKEEPCLDSRDMVGKTYTRITVRNANCLFNCVVDKVDDGRVCYRVGDNTAKHKVSIDIFLKYWKLHEPKLPEFGYDIPVGNFISMNKSKNWMQYSVKPRQVTVGWVTDGSLIHSSIERITPSWHDWKQSLYQMTENGLVHVET